MIKFLKKIAPFLILVSFLILSALLPEILGEDAKALAKNYLGENYQYILVAFFLLLFLLAAYINPEMGLGLFSKTDKNNPERYNIPPTDENHELLRKAKAAIAASHPDQALELLSTLKLEILNREITILSARLADLERAYIRGTLSFEAKNLEKAKINESIILLITALEKEIAQSFEFYDKIRAALKSRYKTRLSQKLSHRQPVKLRLVPSTTGTTPQAAATFVQYSEEEISKKLAEYYDDARGRLLLIGVPGAGKTTLLLQLELELLKRETYHIPVILNLGRWSSKFPTLEAWIQEILPSEMGLTIGKKAAAKLITQNRLILLLDGLDEVREEDRQVCLKAIGTYGGENPNRHFIISSRINEYKAVAKNAPVNNQVEVGPLTYKQLIEQLEKININEGSRRLSAALKEDIILRKTAQVPFYFNTLQLLFAGGKFLSEFNFSALDIEGRKKEIERSFVFEMFQKINIMGYDSQLITRYLGFFASRLKRENLVDFELIHLQYSWYKLSKWETTFGNFLEGLVEFLVVGLCGGVILGVGGGLILGVGIGVILGLLGALVTVLVIALLSCFVDGTPVIKTIEEIKWDWSTIINRKKLVEGIIGGLGLGLALYLGGDLVLYVGEDLVLYLVRGLVFGLILGLVAGILDQMENHNSFIQINDPYQSFKASARVLYFSILQHLHLCRTLHKKELLPKKLITFLRDMVNCNILETTDASWRFRHQILQDYFSDQFEDLEQEENSPIDLSNLSEVPSPPPTKPGL